MIDQNCDTLEKGQIGNPRRTVSNQVDLIASSQGEMGNWCQAPGLLNIPCKKDVII